MKTALSLYGILFAAVVSATPVDLSRITCELPWEQFTTESNTIGILFEDRTEKGSPSFLEISNLPPSDTVLETKFILKSLLESDRSSSFGFQVWEGLSQRGIDPLRARHYLILMTSEGNLEVYEWNGSYYSIVNRKSRFAIRTGLVQTMKVEIMRSGSIKIYLNNKLQLAVRTKTRVTQSFPLRLCAYPGTYVEILSLEIRPFGTP
jgi:hypothetical protein